VGPELVATSLDELWACADDRCGLAACFLFKVGSPTGSGPDGSNQSGLNRVCKHRATSPGADLARADPTRQVQEHDVAIEWAETDEWPSS